MRLSWNEVRARAAVFAEDWKDATYEKGETQSFYNAFFDVFGVRRRNVARYEAHAENLNKGGVHSIAYRSVEDPLARRGRGGGVHRSFCPLPWQRTWAPVPSWTSSQRRSMSSEARNPVCTATSNRVRSRRPVRIIPSTHTACVVSLAHRDAVGILTYSSSIRMLHTVVDRFAESHFECEFSYSRVVDNVASIISLQIAAMGVSMGVGNGRTGEAAIGCRVKW